MDPTNQDGICQKESFRWPRIWPRYLGVSLNSTPIFTPQNDDFYWEKPMVVGYHRFRKHPCSSCGKRVFWYILMKLFFSTAIVSIFHRNTVVFTVFLRIFCHTEKIEDSPKRLLWWIIWVSWIRWQTPRLGWGDDTLAAQWDDCSTHHHIRRRQLFS